jgi:transcriptional regulator with XRE-family HTH domain
VVSGRSATARLPADAWRDAHMRRAWRTRDFRAVFHLACQLSLTPETIAGNTGLPIDLVLNVMKGNAVLNGDSGVAVQVAAGLGMPDDFRSFAGLPPIAASTVSVLRSREDKSSLPGRPHVGERIAELRRERGLTQESLAERAGVSTETVKKIERRKRNPSLFMLETLAKALGVAVGKLTDPSVSRIRVEHPSGAIGQQAIAAYPVTTEADTARQASPAITELCEALTDYGLGGSLLGSGQPDEIPSLRDLERDLRITFGAYQQSRFTTAASRVSALLADAQLTARECEESERARVLRVLALSYQAAASVLTKTGQSDLAWIAAERGLNAAEAADSPSVRGSLIRSVSFALLSAGRFEPAMRLVESGADYLLRETAGDDTALSVYGMLFLAGSMAAARFGDGPRTAGYLEEANSAARRLGKDANCLWTAFGPTNVAIHRVNTAVELGDVQTVLDSGLSLNTNAVPAERRVRYLLDVARVYSMTGNRDDALGTMLSAERIAPEQVRQHHLSRKVVMTLIRSGTGKPAIELEKLARRVNFGEPI